MIEMKGGGGGGEEGAEGGAVGHSYKKEVEERCFNNWTKQKYIETTLLCCTPMSYMKFVSFRLKTWLNLLFDWWIDEVKFMPGYLLSFIECNIMWSWSKSKLGHLRLIVLNVKTAVKFNWIG